MKLVVFAHTPPPHHGQSYMVQLMLDGLKGAGGIEFYHVNCRLSEGLDDIGRARGGKFLPLLRYCLEAIWLRLRHGADHFYYIPASGCRLGMLRDWIIMALCRPFFRRIICHWHAAGLGTWLQTEARPWERWVSRRLLFRPDLSIVLSDYGRRDGEAVLSHRVAVVPNGIPDPAPEFDRAILPQRQVRSAERARLLAPTPAREDIGAGHVFSVLYLSLCCREKGLFDAVEGVSLANRQLAERGWPLRVRMRVAGTFWHASEEAEFRQRLQQPDLTLALAAGAAPGRPGPAIEYVGFVQGEEKRRLLAGSDGFCFPTWYPSESFGLALVEAMAFGLPLITTRWRSIPELLPPNYPGLIEPQSAAAIAAALLGQLERPCDRVLRDRFLACYTQEKFAANLAAALRSVG
jgi:glycosyltransferase involved in cell wall biosynthesis